MSTPVLLSSKLPGREYNVDHMGGQFIIVGNQSQGNRDVFVAPEAAPTMENWKKLLPAPVMTDVTDSAVFEGKLVLIGVEKAYQKAEIVDLSTLAVRDIPAPEQIFAITKRDNPDPKGGKFRFEYTSLVKPSALIDVDLATGAETVLAERKIPGYDASNCVVERVWSPSFDGVQVPTDVIRKKSTPMDGKGPLDLWAYGNYGTSMIQKFTFDQDRISALDRGVILAISYPRGGGEQGYEWGAAGNQKHKIDEFKDVIAVAHDLVAKGYAAADRMALEGISAAGLLTGYIANNEPGLFKAIAQSAPFVDIINTMSDASIPLTTQEYTVWGNPGIAEDYRYMALYSPYDNVGHHDYPAMFVRSALGDSQVPYWESAKWVARIRANKTDQNPLVLAMGMVGSHSGGSGVDAALDEASERWAFILSQIGTR
jgi:oligopeptidase B